jgi:hypothetical protein
MEQLIILLLIALISLINWLVQKSSELRKARKKEQGSATKAESSVPGGPPPQPEPEREISMRRFREALGLPEEAPPPAVPKRKEQPLPPPLPVPPPSAPSPATVVASHLPVVKPKIVRAHTAHRFPEFPHKIGKPAARAIEPEAKASRIRELLDSSGGLRDAVVLSEILGVPKSLRKEEEIFLK